MSAALRPGRCDEAAVLSAPAFRAKAHWGYGDEFMEACRAEPTVTPADLWVDPPRMGAGVGRALRDDAVAAARAAGHSELRAETDPNAMPGRLLPLLAQVL